MCSYAQTHVNPGYLCVFHKVQFVVVVLIFGHTSWLVGLPRQLSGKETTCQTGDVGSIPGLGRSPGGGNGNALQYSCLENSMDRRAWQATGHGVANSQTQLRGGTETAVAAPGI